MNWASFWSSVGGTIFCAALLAIIAQAQPWVKWLYEISQKRAEWEQAKVKAEQAKADAEKAAAEARQFARDLLQEELDGLRQINDQKIKAVEAKIEQLDVSAGKRHEAELSEKRIADAVQVYCENDRRNYTNGLHGARLAGAGNLSAAEWLEFVPRCDRTASYGPLYQVKKWLPVERSKEFFNRLQWEDSRMLNFEAVAKEFGKPE